MTTEQPTPGGVLDALLAGYRDEFRATLQEVAETLARTLGPASPASTKLFLTIPETAALCSISEDVVYRLVASGTWPAYQQGRRWMIDPSAIREHVARLIVEQTEVRRAKQIRRRAAA